MAANLYVHFPFCRSKCAYCALLSRPGAGFAERAEYVASLAGRVRRLGPRLDGLATVYFGGGTPALCDLASLFAALRERGLAPDAEFTVELHPADVTSPLLDALAAGGVNRISMGIQSFDAATLAAMGRGVSVADAVRAFTEVRRVFPNAGFDLIAGYPDAAPLAAALPEMLDRLRPAHVSLYSLIREPRTRLDRDVRQGRISLPSDADALGEIAAVARILAAAGLMRYEISSYALDGMACRHNRAVWRGEDYVGLGEGAHGREGLVRTVGGKDGYARETLTPHADALERALFALRTDEGFDPDATIRRHPVLEPCRARWLDELAFAERQMLAVRKGTAYVLTPRGMEVCDSVIGTLLG